MNKQKAIDNVVTAITENGDELSKSDYADFLEEIATEIQYLIDANGA